LKGRFMWNKLSDKGFTKAVEYFQQAIEKDPTYAPAYVGLADCYWKLADFGFLPPAEAIPKSKAAVERALALDDTLSEAHATRGDLAVLVDWDWQVAEREYRRALDLNPNNATIHAWYGCFLMGMNRRDEALAEIRTAQTMDPISLDTNLIAAMVLYSARQYDQAIVQSRKMCELYPDDSAGPYWLATSYEQKGMYPEAVENYLRVKTLEGASKEQVAALRHSYLKSGMRGYRDKELELIEAGSKTIYSYAGEIARNYAMLGDKERAFQWLEKAYKLHDTSLVGLKIDPRFDNLRRDPRYEDLLRRVGFPP
jgi:tetratricopeptide (TPR) repeat protein